MNLPRQWGFVLWVAMAILGIDTGLPGTVTGSDTARLLPLASPRLVIDAGGHQGIIRQLMFTTDGRELISVSDDKTMRIWSVSPDGRRADLSRTIRGQIGDGREGMLAASAISPPNAKGRQQWLAVGGYLAGPPEARNAVRLHDYASGEVRALLYGHRYSILALAFSPSGRWLASAGKDNTVWLWDVESWQGASLTKAPLVLTGHTGHIYDLAWSPSGDRLASASADHTTSLWNTEQLAQDRVTLVASLDGHDHRVQTVAFHPAGDVLASGGNDQTIRLWRSHDGKARGVLSQTEHKLSALSFSPDGMLLLAGNLDPPKPKRLTVFAYPTGKVHRVFTGHQNLVIATAFHPSGKWVASGGGEYKEILLWNPNTGKILSQLGGRGRTIYAVGFSADGRYLSWGQTLKYTSPNNRGPLEHRFDLESLVRLSGGLPHPSAVRARERVGKLQLVPERGGPYHFMHRLHVKRGVWKRRLYTIERRDLDGHRHSAYSFTPDGKYILSGGLNGVLRLYTRDGKTHVKLVGHVGEIKAVAISADGQWAVTGSNDQTVKLWSLDQPYLTNGAEIAPILTLFPAKDGEWVAWTPKGFLAASKHGAHLIGYSINQGLDKVAQHIPVEQLYAHYQQQDLLAPSAIRKHAIALSDKRDTIAVFDFKTEEAHTEYGIGIAEILRAELAALRDLVITVPRQRLQNVAAAQGWRSQTDVVDDATAIEIGKRVRADRVVVGSVVQFGKTLTVNARAIDVATGDIKAAPSLRVNNKDEQASTSAMLVARDLLNALPVERPHGKTKGFKLMPQFASVLAD